MNTTNSHPTLSIIVISKDDLSGLSDTLRSIAAQSMPPDEVVVVTKGDSDRIRLADFALPRARHAVQQDKGISPAFNLALSLAGGQWINFLNGGDAYAQREVLAAVRPRLAEGINIVAGRARDRIAGNLIPRDLYFHSRRVDQVSHQASFFQRALFEQHGSYSPEFRIRMDFEWILRVAEHARVDWFDAVLVDFEGGGASSIHPWHSCREELDALRRHQAPWSRRARLLGLYLPFRVARNWVRGLGAGRP